MGDETNLRVLRECRDESAGVDTTICAGNRISKERLNLSIPSTRASRDIDTTVYAHS